MNNNQQKYFSNEYPNTRFAKKIKGKYEICNICFDELANITIDCNHTLCSRCLINLNNAKCPYCRKIFPQFKYLTWKSSDKHIIEKFYQLISTASYSHEIKDMENVYSYMCGEGYILIKKNPLFFKISIKKLKEFESIWNEAIHIRKLLDPIE